MNKIFLGAFILIGLSIASCEETNKTENKTNSPDTAVLKEDPTNAMQANPIKDTVFTDTVNGK